MVRMRTYLKLVILMSKACVLFALSLIFLCVGLSVHSSILNIMFVGLSVASITLCESVLDGEHIKYHENKKER